MLKMSRERQLADASYIERLVTELGLFRAALVDVLSLTEGLGVIAAKAVDLY